MPPGKVESEAERERGAARLSKHAREVKDDAAWTMLRRLFDEVRTRRWQVSLTHEGWSMI